MEAVKWVEVVRVKIRGNYADSKKFAIKEYTDEQYDEELKRIDAKFTPLVLECKRLNRAPAHRHELWFAQRSYHESLWATRRAAMEGVLLNLPAPRASTTFFALRSFLMKSSNWKVMIECYRLRQVAYLEKRRPDLNYPIHLGGTEAGEGDHGRDRVWHIGIELCSCGDGSLTPSGCLRSFRFPRAKSKSAAICWPNSFIDESAIKNADRKHLL